VKLRFDSDSELSRDDMNSAGDSAVQSAFEGAGEVIAVTEVKAEVVKRFRAVRTEGILEGRRK
jgi:hypothetical protein